MTARKRKQPDRKKPAKQRGPGLALRCVFFTARLASRHPGIVSGSAAFAIAFSFVAANAMWYQPGAHPSPLMRTRMPFTQPQVSGDETGATPRKVTTFVIQRDEVTVRETAVSEPQDDQLPQKQVREPELPQQQAQREVAQPEPEAETAIDGAAASAPEPAAGTALVMSIQKELARRGLYDGPADGKTGPKTSAAILKFEKQAGRGVTGAADAALLAALKKQPSRTRNAARPTERPYENVKAGKGDLDPVAAAIRNAEINPDYVPKVDIPASSELVMNIQRGLSNLAYADVSVDGVAGEQTRSAIRHFEKHYRLPQTGQPSPAVLKKMKEIGAL
ncbi:peptidoglycan-binding domain-containing protein [Pararhizobium gei]|uniref:peptidoglycan-binding domain-containing protein n=1 Tax=Pararhizobium gei TaxID=1395951 RepID=UPI0023DBE8E2|nr:peptidoglycan-binding protein [Rhizobium gei]